jgi:hypothetical protein
VVAIGAAAIFVTIQIAIVVILAQVLAHRFAKAIGATAILRRGPEGHAKFVRDAIVAAAATTHPGDRALGRRRHRVDRVVSRIAGIRETEKKRSEYRKG